MRGIMESTKQFNTSLQQIMFHQTRHAPQEFASMVHGEGGKKRGREDEIVGEYADAITKLTKETQLLPTYIFPIPKLIVIFAVRTLQHRGLHAQGIFRKSINMQQLEQLIREVDAGHSTTLTISTETDTTNTTTTTYTTTTINCSSSSGEGACHTYAVLLKTWLRKLDDPLIPDAEYTQTPAFVKECAATPEREDDENGSQTYGSSNTFAYYNCNEGGQGGEDVSAVTAFVNTHLNPTQNLTLKYLIRFLRVFTIKPYVLATLMHVKNISVVMAPTINRRVKTDATDAKDANAASIALVNLQHDMDFMEVLLRTLCITAAEENLFESLDTSVRRELNIPDSRSVLSYYTWG